MKSKLFFLCITALLFVACSSDDDPTPNIPSTKAELETKLNKYWKVDNTDSEYVSFQFNADGTYKAVKKDGNDYTGTYTVSGDLKTATLSDLGTITFSELTDSSLKFWLKPAGGAEIFITCTPGQASPNPTLTPYVYAIKSPYDYEYGTYQIVEVNMLSGEEKRITDLNIEYFEHIAYLPSTNELLSISRSAKLYKYSFTNNSLQSVTLDSDAEYDGIACSDQNVYAIKNFSYSIVHIVQIDINTGVETILADIPGSPDVQYSFHIAYNKQTSEVVATTRNNTLVKVNVNTKNVTTLNLDQAAAEYDGVACNGDKVYAIKNFSYSNVQIVEIAINTGAEKQIAILPDASYSLHITYSPQTKEVVAISRHENMMYKVNVDTKVITSFKLDENSSSEYDGVVAVSR